jgi:hypothetical protein
MAADEEKRGACGSRVPDPSADQLAAAKAAEGKKDSGRRSRLPPDWRLPDTWRSWAAASGLSEAQIDEEAAKFADHWHGTGDRRDNWEATWRNWCRRAKEYALRGASKPDKMLAAQAQTMRILRGEDSAPGSFSVSAAQKTTGGSPRNTDESFPDYRRRMIEEGKYDPSGENA